MIRKIATFLLIALLTLVATSVSSIVLRDKYNESVMYDIRAQAIYPYDYESNLTEYYTSRTKLIELFENAGLVKQYDDPLIFFIPKGIRANITVESQLTIGYNYNPLVLYVGIKLTNCDNKTWEGAKSINGLEDKRLLIMAPLWYIVDTLKNEPDMIPSDIDIFTIVSDDSTLAINAAFLLYIGIFLTGVFFLLAFINCYKYKRVCYPVIISLRFCLSFHASISRS